ncbi:protein SFI1 homolog [Ochotona curzoniae]|uniref:protein SFI1 homolog n=1 Tax=Ochotona curzoniae TaxID=130825 RepID=UPI001B353DD5|nr:protein SFI1 homolog [Ochotona curzoniae]
MEKVVESRSSRGGALKKAYSPKMISNRRSAFSGIRRELPGTSHPAQHLSSRARMRQGRLRELRSRCVGRKYLYLWIRVTFGRVFPSQARFYHKQRVLRRVFEAWKEEWWVSHQEWKLCVRADCHYRYYLYNLMFQNWKSYVRQQQESRIKSLMAEEHDARQKVRRAWKSWLIYVVVRRTKLEMHAAALEFRQQSILRVGWRKWRQQLGQACRSRALQASAVKHRALNLQLQAWSQWREQLLQSQRGREKAVSAVIHHQNRQKQRCLQAWLRYLDVRRAKRQKNEMARRFHRATMLQIHFCDWQWALERRQSLYAQQAPVQELAKRMALRRAFVHWKHYMLLCAEEVALVEMAEDHYRLSLLHFCFRALKGNVARARLQRIRKNLAHQQHSVTLLRRFWDLWQCRIEQREEREQVPLLHTAWDHYRTALQHKCIKSWLQYTRKRQHKQLQRARADGHFQQRALPATFHAWHGLWRWRQQESILYVRATRFHRETLEKKAFSLWWQKMLEHRENRLAERMAILFAEQQLLRRSWAVWRQQAAARHREQEWQAMACAHHCHGRLRKAFCTWRDSAWSLRTERTGRAQAVKMHSARLLRWAWSRWQESLALQRAEQRKLLRANLHHQRAQLRQALRKWLTYREQVQRVLQEVAARERRHHRRLLRWALHRWRQNTVARVDEARRASRAEAHYRRTLCSKVLIQWREVASVRIYYRQRAACTVVEAQKALERGRLRTWFRRWRDCSRRSAQQRAQLERAAQHHGRQLLQEGLAQWKVYHLGCVRKRLLQRQGARLLARRLSWTCFHQWRRQLEARRQEQQATARALWFWAFSLQAKVWTAWLGFVLERRRKKARLEQALQVYHQQLLRQGATQLLRFTADRKAARQQLQAQQQVQAAHSLHRAVLRCALLWKHKVLGRGPRPAAPVIPNRRVTFEGPLLDRAALQAVDATLDTKRPRAPWPQGILDSAALAAGEPSLRQLGAAVLARKQPRRPHFLLEPVQSLGSLGTEKPQARGQPCPSLLRPLQPGALASAPHPKLPPGASAGPELLPPSSFVPRGAGAPARVSALLTSPGLKIQDPPPPTSVPNPHLLLPGDFTGTRAEPGPEVAGHTDLEDELEGIQQQLQRYQTTQQNLRSCQRQASSLRRWLELSREEPRPEDQAEEQQVQRELEEVEMEIQQLAEELRAQRQPVGACIARIQALRQALC